MTLLFLTVFTSEVLGKDPQSKKILYYDYTYRYIHQPTIDHNGQPGTCGTALKKMAAKLGYEVVCTKDGSFFDGDLSQYAAFVFYTSGELDHPGGKIGAPMTEKGMNNFFKAIRSGTGFLGIHSAAVNPQPKDAAPDAPGAIYSRMLGAQFIGHGKEQISEVFIMKPGELPSIKSEGSFFDLHEEWYRTHQFTNDLHVLLVLNTKKMTGKIYQCPPIPVAWIRQEGQGRIAWHAFGHRNNHWSNPLILGITGDLLEFVLGLREMDLTPNLDKVPAEIEGLKK